MIPKIKMITDINGKALPAVRRIATVADLRVGDLVFFSHRGWREAKIVKLIPKTPHAGKIIPPRCELIIIERGALASVHVEHRAHLIPFCFHRRGDDKTSYPPYSSRESNLKHAAELWNLAAEIGGVVVGA